MEEGSSVTPCVVTSYAVESPLPWFLDLVPQRVTVHVPAEDRGGCKITCP